MFWVGMERWAVPATPNAARERGHCWSALKTVRSEPSVAGKVSRGRRGGYPQINADSRRFSGVEGESVCEGCDLVVDAGTLQSRIRENLCRICG